MSTSELRSADFAPSSIGFGMSPRMRPPEGEGGDASPDSSPSPLPNATPLAPSSLARALLLLLLLPPPPPTLAPPPAPTPLTLLPSSLGHPRAHNSLTLSSSLSWARLEPSLESVRPPLSASASLPLLPPPPPPPPLPPPPPPPGGASPGLPLRPSSRSSTHVV